MKLDLILSKQPVETNIGGLKIDVQKTGEGGQVSGTSVCQGAVIGPIGDKSPLAAVYLGAANKPGKERDPCKIIAKNTASKP